MNDNRNENGMGEYEYKPETNQQTSYTNANGANPIVPPLNNTTPQQTQWSYNGGEYNSLGTSPLTPPQPPKSAKPPKPPKPPKKGGSTGLKIFTAIISVMLVASIVVLGNYVLKDIDNDKGGNTSSTASQVDDGNSKLNIKDTPSADTDTPDTDGRLTNQAVFKKASPSVVGVVVYAKSGGTHQVWGQGSGVILSEDGYVVTNAHVVISEDPSIQVSKIEVVLSNSDYYPAEIIGTDTKTDIGVLKISASGLTPAEFGDSSKLEVGEDVVVIGNPDGLEFANSLTTGSISALEREVQTETTGKPVKYIQTDATINPGNSGGALVNQYGQVVGIPVAKIVKSGFEGMGFAIPINDAKPVIDSIIKNGYVAGRAKIGITYAVMPESYAMINNLPNGFRVIAVDETFDAYKQGVAPGDIITHMDGVAMIDSAALASVIDVKSPGDTITFTIFRVDETGNTKTLDVTITLGEDKPVQ